MNTPTLPPLQEFAFTDHEVMLLHQSLEKSISQIILQKASVADMITNRDSAEPVFEFYAKRHKALVDIKNKLFGKKL